MEHIYTEIMLPFPPSTNRIWRSVRGRNIKSKQYCDWIELAGHKLNRQKVIEIKGRYHLQIDVGRKRNKDGKISKVHPDLDNLCKAVNDLLEEHKIIENDKLMQSLTMRWTDTIEGARVIIEQDMK